jgi:glycosyltransferase involved in cell wall biosynthesis
MRSYAQGAFGVSERKVVVRSMGVDTANLFTFEVSKKPSSIVFVGRMVEKKGLHTLLGAAKILQDEGADFSLDIIGGGESLAMYQGQAMRCGLQSNVKFLGSLDSHKVAEHLKCSAIAVFPFCVDKNGDQEGLGLTMVEAMASGCSVIASDLPAIKDVIQDGINGLVVESQNPRLLADKIKYLIANDAMRERLALSGRKTAEDKFDWVVVGQDYSSMFSALARNTKV